MKRYGNLYEQICSMDNLRKAHQNAKKGKGWYEEVKEVEADVDGYLTRLQEMLINHTYQTSQYENLSSGKTERNGKFSNCLTSRIVFVNGQFCKSLNRIFYGI